MYLQLRCVRQMIGQNRAKVKSLMVFLYTCSCRLEIVMQFLGLCESLQSYKPQKDMSLFAK